MNKKPIVLTILDGYGISERIEGNAVSAANTPNMDSLFEKYPFSYINASGLDVGLPNGQMGNSEVGHTNIGAGRIVYQELTRITKSVEDETFFENEVFLRACENSKKYNSSLHLMGLLSDGGVHSHNTHIYALLKLVKKQGVKNVYVHCFLDGRDVSPTSGAGFIEDLEKEINKIGVGKIATVMGRYYAMDRDNRWERVEQAYNAMVKNIGAKAISAKDAVEKSYKDGVTDEFVVPTVIVEGANIKENDSIIFFNFRPDRAREITRSIVEKEFSGFARTYFNTFFVCLTQYDADMPGVEVAFSPQTLKNTFGEYISSLGLKQLRIAETEKYAHVTFFFNGGVEEVYEGEDRILVPSPKVATYDLQPEMSAFLVCDKVLDAIGSGKYDVIILNFANCDMVGHTGVMEAAKKAVEAVDKCVGKIVEKILEVDGVLLITADHGNAEQMLDEDANVFTAHTTNKVPLIVLGLGNIKIKEGRLADLTPTMLDIMNIEKPAEMTGESLIEK